MHNKLLTLISLFAIQFAFGQGNSPYSQFGLGEVIGLNFQSNFSMGGLKAGISGDKLLNPGNPASYSKLKYTIAEVGVFSSQNWFGENGENGTDNRTDIGAIGFGIPLGNKMGIGFGLSQVSSLGYSFSENGTYSDLSSVKYSYSGSGGINNVFLGVGGEFKGFSLGVNGTYNFGRIIKTTKIQFDNTDFENTRFRKYAFVSGFSMDAGFQYKNKINEKYSYTIGGTYGLNNSLSTTNYTTSNIYTVSNSIENHNFPLTIDTEDNPEKNFLNLPSKYNAGIVISKENKWSIGLDYNFNDWSSFDLNGQNQGFGNSQQFILGMETTPNAEAIGSENYWKMVNYRFGIKYGTTPYIYNNIAVAEYGINFGCTFPLRKMKYDSEKFGSYIVASFEYSKRGMNDPSLIQEDFFKLNLSIVLNDKWFIKRKFK